jgi:hypothetical protein
VIGGLLRRCVGDAAFAIRCSTFEALGGFSEGVELSDRAHHLLCRAAIAGVAIDVLPDPLVHVPAGVLAPISIVEQSHRRTAIVELYSKAPPAILAGLPLLTQQLYSLGVERERQFAELYENRFGRLTIPIRRSVGRLRQIQARRGRGPS